MDHFSFCLIDEFVNQKQEYFFFKQIKDDSSTIAIFLVIAIRKRKKQVRKNVCYMAIYLQINNIFHPMPKTGDEK